MSSNTLSLHLPLGTESIKKLHFQAWPVEVYWTHIRKNLLRRNIYLLSLDIKQTINDGGIATDIKGRSPNPFSP
jgi:hypothetical protein